jgi:hypothetical protein
MLAACISMRIQNTRGHVDVLSESFTIGSPKIKKEKRALQAHPGLSRRAEK